MLHISLVLFSGISDFIQVCSYHGNGRNMKRKAKSCHRCLAKFSIWPNLKLKGAEMQLTSW